MGIGVGLCALLCARVELMERGSLCRGQRGVECLVLGLVEGTVEIVGLAPVVTGGGKHLLIVEALRRHDGGHGVVEVEALIAGQAANFVRQRTVRQGAGSHEDGDVLLSHIPVVILTAKVTDQDKITGYQEGADVYMTKPFNPTLLQTVIDNLLTSRSKLREMLLSGAGQPDSEPEDAEETGEIRLSAADRAFVDKLRQYVDANISDSSLSISDISAEMCMSRASFFRKIKSLTGVTPNNFILIYRLNKAAAMIRSREYRLNEIADLAGFSSQSHFSRCFKQHFGRRRKTIRIDGGGG